MSLNSNISLIGDGNGTFFYTTDGVDAHAFPNEAVRREDFLEIISFFVKHTRDNTVLGGSNSFAAYVNNGLAFVSGTTENLALAVLQAGATEVTNVLDFGHDLEDVTLAGGVATLDRNNSTTFVVVANEGGAGTDDLDTITVNNVQQYDRVVVTRNVAAGDITTVKDGTGNISLRQNKDFVINEDGKTIELIWSGAEWQEVIRSPELTDTEQVAVPTGVGTLTLDPATNDEVQILTGTGARTGSYTVSGAGTPYDGLTWLVFYEATFTGATGGNTVSIFGNTLTEIQASKGSLLVIAVYDGTAGSYRTRVLQDVTATEWVEEAMMADASVDNDALADLTRGFIKIGDATNRPADVDISADGAVVLGDGTDAAPQVITEDIDIAGATGVATNKNTGNVLDQASVAGAANGGTSEEILLDDTPTAAKDKLERDGDYYVMRAWGTTAATANAKTIRIRIGGSTASTGTVVAVNTTTGSPNALDWEFEATVIRTGAAAGLAVAKMTFDGVATEVARFSLAETWANDLEMKLTAECPTAASDVTAYGFVSQKVKKPS